MGSFALPYRPKGGGAEEAAKPSHRPPGSNLHKTRNDPKVTKPKPSQKAAKSNEDTGIKRARPLGVVLAETEGRFAQMILETAPIASSALTTNNNTQTTDITQSGEATLPDQSTQTDDIEMVDAPACETPTNPRSTKLTPRAVRSSVHVRSKRAEEVAEKSAEAERERGTLAEIAEVVDGKKKYYEEMCQKTCSTIHSGAKTADITMTDATGYNNSATGFDITSGNWTDAKKTSYNLKSYMSKVGMLYADLGYARGQPRLLSKDQRVDAAVLQALWSQQATREKNELQALIASVFKHAVLKIAIEGLSRTGAEELTFPGGDVPEDDYTYEAPRQEFTLEMWDTFQRELWCQFPKETWPRKLSKSLFVKVFSVLADARLREQHFPKHDGREHPALVRAITEFLDAASKAGIPWMMTYTEDAEDSEDPEGEEAEGDH